MKFNYYALLRRLKRLDYKHDWRVISVLVVIAVIVGIGACFGIKKLYFLYSKQVYEVAIMARSQTHPDPVEDKKSSLKYGDVISVKPERHSWSQLESMNFLIIKMKLNRGQVIKLTEPKYKKISYEQLTIDEKNSLNERIKKEGLKEVPKDIVAPRQYRINMEKYFKDFDPLSLLHKQPYQLEIYNWSLTEKK